MRRLVRVLIVDPNENVPLERCKLYDSGEMFTELDDQELFFNSGIMEKLKEHNTYRTTLVNKKVKDRTESLEPARVRDLRMTVIQIATF